VDIVSHLLELRHCAVMSLDSSFPCCPPAPWPQITDYLIAAGWPCDAGPARAAALWLSEQGIHCERDFVGLEDIQFLPDAESLPLEAIDFLQTLVRPINVLLDVEPLGKDGSVGIARYA